mgnify:FL=1
MIHRSAHLKSLRIEYPRINEDRPVVAILYHPNDKGMHFKLPVLFAGRTGIEIRLPSLVSGMFYLKIEDGEHSFLRPVALQ